MERNTEAKGGSTALSPHSQFTPIRVGSGACYRPRLLARRREHFPRSVDTARRRGCGKGKGGCRWEVPLPRATGGSCYGEGSALNPLLNVPPRGPSPFFEPHARYRIYHLHPPPLFSPHLHLSPPLPLSLSYVRPVSTRLRIFLISMVPRGGSSGRKEGRSGMEWNGMESRKLVNLVFAVGPRNVCPTPRRKQFTGVGFWGEGFFSAGSSLFRV